MADVTRLTVTKGQDQFYPTPPELAVRMLAGIDWSEVNTMLEPSAGKGDLVEAVGLAAFGGKHDEEYDFRYHRNKTLEVDCIEIDPQLRAVLAYQFSDERKREEYGKIKSRHDNGNIFESDWTPLYRALDKTEVKVIHDDFITYRGYKHYDLIVMNPPFATGAEHLLKAIEVQRNGGGIVCLLNAETLRNRYSVMRKMLWRQLEKHGATVSYISNAFANAERRADVEVAIVKISIPREKRKSTIYERMKEAVEVEEAQYESESLVLRDDIAQAVQHYNYECAAGVELIREYEALRPHLLSNIYAEGDSNALYNSCILTLSIGSGRNDLQEISINKFLRQMRLKYWRALFRNPKFTCKLTSKLQDAYSERVESMADYDFTQYNIKQVEAEMNAQIADGVKEAISMIFDKLTAEHSWIPETKNNVHYFDGWATNKAHKIGKKSIVPSNGVFSSYSWTSSTFSVHNAYSLLADIEKVFNYLDGNMTAEVNLQARLDAANSADVTKNIECKYFKVDFFKKGTTHIKYTNPALVERLNIYAARNRNWLPPNYGRAKYSEMAPEERAVVDSFQGEAAYAEVLQRADYYLAEPTRSVAMIGTGE